MPAYLIVKPPKPKSPNALRSKVFKLIKSARIALGLKPLRRFPKGWQGNPFGCPVAVGLNSGCMVSAYGVWGKPKVIAKIARAWGLTPKRTRKRSHLDSPSVVSEFVIAFDFGFYPKLSLGVHGQQGQGHESE